jgi:hypothetical protein
MSLPSPNLDDRDFAQLLEEATLHIQQSCPEWTDFSPSNPGMVLLELFAHLTETMIYRLNRLPQKAYVEFLNLLGVRLRPPAAAVVTLRFRRSGASEQALQIPAGVRVTVNRSDSAGEPPIFTTARTVLIPPGESSVETLAYHCDLVEGELAGLGTGLAGLTVQARQAPIIAPTGDDLDLLVGVEAAGSELDERAPAKEYGGKVYRIWREVDSFSYSHDERHLYIADRLAGKIIFAPAARLLRPDGALEETPRTLANAAIPPAGREIRLWYRRGGGLAGNVAANTLTVLKDAIPGVEATNPAPAVGGHSAESLENALIRGPQEMHSLERAVTARDFEALALASSGAVARAKAITRAALWKHAAPGTVEVLLVPNLPAAQGAPSPLPVETLHAQQTEATRQQIQRNLDLRRPLGASCVVSWARYKPIRVRARVVVRRQENKAAVRQRILDRLYGVICPLPNVASSSGWRFGQSLRASHIYDVALAEPGLLWVDRVRFQVDEAPDKAIAALAADFFQPGAWYAGSGATLFRSLDNGEGWEPLAHFAQETVSHICAHSGRAGLLAVITQPATSSGARIHLSYDCGESWLATPTTLSFAVNGVDWTLRQGAPLLLLASDAGLYEFESTPESSPVQILVDAQNQALGFYDVVAGRDLRGQVSVAVAAQGNGGIFFSHQGGQRNTFRRIGLQGEDIRVLAVQYDGARAFLWAGAFAASPEDKGKGCFRRELLGSQDPPEGWRPFTAGWDGGSCRALAFAGAQVFAASHRLGVLRLDAGQANASWTPSDVRCGLPLRDAGRFQPVVNVAAGDEKWVMAGTADGVFRSKNGGVSYQAASAKEFSDKVTLPPTWLFCSGQHEIEVVSEDEAERD